MHKVLALLLVIGSAQAAEPAFTFHSKCVDQNCTLYLKTTQRVAVVESRPHRPDYSFLLAKNGVFTMDFLITEPVTLTVTGPDSTVTKLTPIK